MIKYLILLASLSLGGCVTLVKVPACAYQAQDEKGNYYVFIGECKEEK